MQSNEGGMVSNWPCVVIVDLVMAWKKRKHGGEGETGSYVCIG